MATIPTRPLFGARMVTRRVRWSVRSTRIAPYPAAMASFGVPAPMICRISNERLWPATWSRYRL